MTEYQFGRKTRDGYTIWPDSDGELYFDGVPHGSFLTATANDETLVDRSVILLDALDGDLKAHPVDNAGVTLVMRVVHFGDEELVKRPTPPVVLPTALGSVIRGRRKNYPFEAPNLWTLSVSRITASAIVWLRVDGATHDIAPLAIAAGTDIFDPNSLEVLFDAGAEVTPDAA